MKTPEKNAKPDAKKQKKQIVALGALSAVFVAVMLVQFGGSKPQQPEVAALAAVPDAAAPAAADAAAAPVVAPVAQDNSVLSAPTTTADMKRSPFSNFWSAPSSGTKATVADVAAPRVTVNATLPSATRGMAIIDGELHFVGDTIGGWQLAEVRPRAIVLHGPTPTSEVVVDMPLLAGKIALPDASAPDAKAASPAAPVAPAAAAAHAAHTGR